MKLVARKWEICGKETIKFYFPEYLKQKKIASKPADCYEMFYYILYPTKHMG
jgi:hypothetical protein